MNRKKKNGAASLFRRLAFFFFLAKIRRSFSLFFSMYLFHVSFCFHPKNINPTSSHFIPFSVFLLYRGFIFIYIYYILLSRFSRDPRGYNIDILFFIIVRFHVSDTRFLQNTISRARYVISTEEKKSV